MNSTNLGLYIDTRGNHHEVLEFVKGGGEFRTLHNGKSVHTDGFKDYKTSTGIELNRVGDQFKTLDGETLSKA